MSVGDRENGMAKRFVAFCAATLIIVGLYIWYARSRDVWYGAGSTGRQLLRVAVSGNNPPFSFLDRDGNLAGFDVDIAQSLCDRLHMQCRFVQQSWNNNMISFLLNGKYDAVVSSLPILRQWVPYINYSNKYYTFPAKDVCCGPEADSLTVDGGRHIESWRFVSRKGGEAEISPAGLAGKRIGILRLSRCDDFLRTQYPDAIRVLYDSQASANLDMASGQLDLLLADSRTLSETFLATSAGKNFEFIGPPVTDPLLLGSDAGIAVRKGDAELLQAINRALAEIRADGTYKKLNDKYFDFDVYGG